MYMWVLLSTYIHYYVYPGSSAILHKCTVRTLSCPPQGMSINFHNLKTHQGEVAFHENWGFLGDHSLGDLPVLGIFSFSRCFSIQHTLIMTSNLVLLRFTCLNIDH